MENAATKPQVVQKYEIFHGYEEVRFYSGAHVRKTNDGT